MIERTIDKLMDEDPELSLEDAASHAVYAHNDQINKRGFSPRQIMFGKRKIAYRVLDPANTQRTRWNDHDNQRKPPTDKTQRRFINR